MFEAHAPTVIQLSERFEKLQVAGQWALLTQAELSLESTATICRQARAGGMLRSHSKQLVCIFMGDMLHLVLLRWLYCSQRSMLSSKLNGSKNLDCAGADCNERQSIVYT